MAITDSDLDLAQYIDHSLLIPTATSEQLEAYCQQAEQYRFPTVCVYPAAVKQAVQLLHGKKTLVSTVIGFPAGATTSAVKRYEALEAADNGAKELDVVINLGWLKDGKSEQLFQEIASICQETGQTVKAILETSQLTDTEKRLAAEICMDAGVSYLKTSTGWFGGATVSDVKFLKEISKGRVGIKASGGIRTLEQAIALIRAGATRLGTSRGVDLVRQQKAAFEE
ncbi:MAG: deoxyribose-phosphate aldolase [Microcystis sp.]|jgi:deoxyribose-phosphate aldolase|uniref:Deoxyribose-phosphate aldolase n=1 Tax=Microcystis aeruginosa G11-04 TaxID=2685956 RepID=A0A966L706_MICAE|nr:MULTISPECIES: deoxyribose-phosphate aldolase [unclassified Microcystis]NCQ70741.1 deoxyribose-phosphate aldolase [Microcystis aeruginosa W13-16]NCQ75283.1 deoxyribose-phosphate aldolase [Microcystis aeruginosa W13-13]NCQ79696.1 deoxyribose-phosphate aldolase [Microcystis aeruginosa W13-15]NCR13515.1 deoxyribose-phosphate aldolase [Microcystis aeruginosa SX13-11]NCR18832.1 deoxyribose-phosphate aldolase [Microcystis aeruginosa LL13-03]NCR23010.1 deoxyribose-phosphate aldolase [Microcystis a